MIQKKLKQLIDKYCMGVVPTDVQQDEIFDMVAKLGADQQEVADYMRKMQDGPTREEVEAKKKMLEEKRIKEELAAKQEAENLDKQKAERGKQIKDEENNSIATIIFDIVKWSFIILFFYYYIVVFKGDEEAMFSEMLRLLDKL